MVRVISSQLPIYWILLLASLSLNPFSTDKLINIHLLLTNQYKEYKDTVWDNLATHQLLSLGLKGLRVFNFASGIKAVKQFCIVFSSELEKFIKHAAPR